MENILSIARFSDTILNKKVNVLVKILWLLPIVMTITFGIAVVVMPQNSSRYIIIVGLLWLVSLSLMQFSKKGYSYLSSVLFVAILIIMIIGFSWTGGGIKGHGFKLLPIIILFAGLALGKREVWLFGGIAIIGGLAITLADYFNLIPINKPLGDSVFIHWLYISTSILILCFIENLSVGELIKALKESQKEVLLRKKSEELLKIKNEKLTKIAFLQSHIVRKPVANVLGLVTLIKSSNLADPANLELLSHLEISAKELDSVIHEIVRNTEEIEYLVENGK